MFKKYRRLLYNDLTSQTKLLLGFVIVIQSTIVNPKDDHPQNIKTLDKTIQKIMRRIRPETLLRSDKFIKQLPIKISLLENR